MIQRNRGFIGADDARPAQPTAAELAEHIAAKLIVAFAGHLPPPAASVPLVPAPTAPAETPAETEPPPDTRTSTPGVQPPPAAEIPAATLATPAPPLPTLFDDFYARTKDQKTASSWSSFRTFFRKWRRHFGNDGPPANQLTPETIQAFFESVPEWRDLRTWKKNADCLWQTLHAACHVALDNRNGLPADSAPLRKDTLPAWFTPTARWFIDRADKTPDAPQRKGGHTPTDLPAITVEEFAAVLDATESAEYMAPLWWRAWLSLFWFNAPRIQDSLRYRYDAGRLHIDTKRHRLHFVETKKTNDGAPYLPPWLRDLFVELRAAQIAEDIMPNQNKDQPGALVFLAEPGTRHNYKSGPKPLNILPRGDAANEGRRLKPEFRRLFAIAGVELRDPHDFRNTAVSNWFEHAPEYRFEAMGHAPPTNDTQKRNYQRHGEPYRIACETYPYPLKWYAPPAAAPPSRLILPPGM
jgi:hypothetical protein